MLFLNYNIIIILIILIMLIILIVLIISIIILLGFPISVSVIFVPVSWSIPKGWLPSSFPLNV